MLWIRFDQLDLAADQSVARLPKELLLVVGAHALLGPLLVGFLVILLLLLIAPLDDDGTLRSRFWVVMVPVGLVAAIIVWSQLRGLDDIPHKLVVWFAVACGTVAIVSVAIRGDRVRYILWVVFAAFAFCGAVLLVARTSGKPRMEPVAVLLEEGQRGVAGFYVGETSDRLFIAPLPGSGDPGDPFADAQIDRIVSVARSEASRMALREPVGIAPEDPGRDQAQALLAELQQETVSQQPRRTEFVTTINPVVAFAPLVHLHSQERLFPMSARGFLDNSWLAWAHPGCDPFVVALGRHVAKPVEHEGSIAGHRRAPPGLAEARLGAGSTIEHPATAGGCRDRRTPAYSTAQHTRPFDARARAAGLPLREGFYLDLSNKARVGHDEPNREGAQTLLGNVPAYFESHPERAGARPGIRITYWLLYGHSRPPPADVTGPIAHEGDWERISVLVARGDQQHRYAAISVRYHFHDESRDVPWYAVKRVAAGGPEAVTHPVVFSARGSHASYPRAGRYENEFRLRGRRRFVVHDDAIACPRCPQWQTWKQLIDATTQPWYGFGGAWGAVGRIGGTTGPLGPSSLKTRGRETPPEATVRESPPVPRADRVEELIEDE